MFYKYFKYVFLKHFLNHNFHIILNNNTQTHLPNRINWYLDKPYVRNTIISTKKKKHAHTISHINMIAKFNFYASLQQKASDNYKLLAQLFFVHSNYSDYYEIICNSNSSSDISVGRGIIWFHTTWCT